DGSRNSATAEIPKTLAVDKQLSIMRRKILITLFVCTTTIIFGQDNFKRNDIYLEAGGNGLFGSVNYERQLTKQPGLSARIGVGFYSENAFYLSIPVGINYLFKLKGEKS